MDWLVALLFRPFLKAAQLLLLTATIVATDSASAAWHQAEQPVSGLFGVPGLSVGIGSPTSPNCIGEIFASPWDRNADDAVAAKSTATIVGRSVGAREVMWSGKKITNELAETLGVGRKELVCCPRNNW